MRRLIAFPCKGETLVGTIDEAAGPTGLLIVSGGNEIRCGAHRGMAAMAARVAEAGFPVFRYDRRGIGDSSGENGRFLTTQTDLVAAIAAFRALDPSIRTLVGFGNCDAASALALFGGEAGLDRVLLANPWTIEDEDDLPPAAAIRARYAERLLSPGEWGRLARGEVNFIRLFKGLKKITTPHSRAGLAHRVVAAIDAWDDRAHILLARGDATAIAFRAVAKHLAVETIDTDSHSFAGDAQQALQDAVLMLLRRSTG